MSEFKRKVSILLVDDHPIVRECLANYIAREPDLQVCGEAEDVHDAIQKVKTLDPDLVVVDGGKQVMFIQSDAGSVVSGLAQE